MKFQPVVKWSGSKRSQSEEIVKRFPKEIDTYYEPFVGGASILFQLLHSDVKVNRYVCSDINSDLINLWNMIKEKPEFLCSEYESMWKELNKDNDTERKKKYYYEIRDRFNTKKAPQDFMFLSRTCMNGLIRYNSKGEFNTSFHFSRPGIHPDSLKELVTQWSTVINKFNVEFICQDYSKIQTKENDFMYLDPPYASTKGMYFGAINYCDLWEFLRNSNSGYILSFNGFVDNKDNTYNVPEDIYSKHELIYSGVSSLKKMHNKTERVRESLYISQKK